MMPPCRGEKRYACAAAWTAGDGGPLTARSLALAISAVALLALPLGVVAVPPPAAGHLAATALCEEKYVSIGRGPLLPCSLTTRATLSVQGCPGDVCAFTLSVDARSESEVTGLHAITTTMLVGEYFGVCIGPKAVSDVLHPAVPCARVCESDTLGTDAECVDERGGSARVRPGECLHVYVDGSYDYSRVEDAWTLLLFGVCRDAQGAVSVPGHVLAGRPVS